MSLPPQDSYSGSAPDVFCRCIGEVGDSDSDNVLRLGTRSDVGRRSCGLVVGSHDPGILSWTPRVLHSSRRYLHRGGALITGVKGGEDDLGACIPP